MRDAVEASVCQTSSPRHSLAFQGSNRTHAHRDGHGRGNVAIFRSSSRAIATTATTPRAQTCFQV